MEYKATFKIDHGVCKGIGSSYPETTTKTEDISAENLEDALEKALDIAEKFADNHFCNPLTNETTVQILSLQDPDGIVPLNYDKAVITKSALEHALEL